MFGLIQKLASATIIFLVLFIATTKSANAQMMAQGMMGGRTSEVESSDELHESLDEVLAGLLAKYNKATIQELSCNDLKDEEFEQIGDAVMESMHPGEAHERMDEMMGGEGSEALRLMHIQMGQRYLGCETSTPGGWSTGMMGPMMMFGNNMMGGGVSGYKWPLAAGTKFVSLHAIFVVITWVSFIAFLLAGARWFWKRAGK